jgi:hypothetical protein
MSTLTHETVESVLSITIEVQSVFLNTSVTLPESVQLDTRGSDRYLALDNGCILQAVLVPPSTFGMQ